MARPREPEAREANIALGHWSHQADQNKSDEYAELVESLAASRSSTDVHVAFFLRVPGACCGVNWCCVRSADRKWGC